MNETSNAIINATKQQELTYNMWAKLVQYILTEARISETRKIARTSASTQNKGSEKSAKIIKVHAIGSRASSSSV
jgi:hypothetical protein